MRKAALVAVLLSSLTGLCVSADPLITLSSDRVVVSNLTPGEGVYQLVVAREYRGYRSLVSADADHVEDGARTGWATMAAGRRIPQNSIWIAVDPKTGASTIATPRPEGIEIEKVRLNPGQLRKATKGGQFVSFLWVRPGVGAWTLEAEDSGRYDGDPSPDGILEIDVERMSPVGDSPTSPHQLAPGDVLFAVDVLNLTVLELR